MNKNVIGLSAGLVHPSSLIFHPWFAVFVSRLLRQRRFLANIPPQHGHHRQNDENLQKCHLAGNFHGGHSEPQEAARADEDVGVVHGRRWSSKSVVNSRDEINTSL